MEDGVKPANSVAAAVSDADLSDALSLIHRNGLGPNVRVFHPDRGDMPGRLLRAGLPAGSTFLTQVERAPVVLIHAPNRIELAAGILRSAGARLVESFASTVSTPSTLLNVDPSIFFSSRRSRSRTYESR
jgi:hypothetical protein